jgi:hypothetical protein
VEFSVSEGHIIGFKEVLARDGFSFEVIESDAYTNFGSSGGGLYNKDGNLIGINTWIDQNYQEGYAISYHFLNNLNETFLFCEEDSYAEGKSCVKMCKSNEIRNVVDEKCYGELGRWCEDPAHYCEDKEYKYCYRGECWRCPDADTSLFGDGKCYYSY